MRRYIPIYDNRARNILEVILAKMKVFGLIIPKLDQPSSQIDDRLPKG